MSLIAEVLSSAAGGGLLGSVGGILQGIIKYFQDKAIAKIELEKITLQNAQEIKRWEHDSKMLDLEMKYKVDLAELEKQKEITLADLSAMTESFKADRATYATPEAINKYGGWMVGMDFIRGLIRPVITFLWSIFFFLFSGYVFWYVLVYMPELLTKGDFLERTSYALIDTLVFTTSTVTLWWFASRGQQANLARKG